MEGAPSEGKTRLTQLRSCVAGFESEHYISFVNLLPFRSFHKPLLVYGSLQDVILWCELLELVAFDGACSTALLPVLRFAGCCRNALQSIQKDQKQRGLDPTTCVTLA